VSDRRSLLVGVAVIAAGLAAVLGATLVGDASGAVNGIASWPPVVRAAFVGVFVAIGLALVARAIAMLGERADADGRAPAPEARDVRTMIRGVRLVFLALASFAAAGVFLVGHPLLLVVAVVIAGVDVVETSFLLLVARTHRGDDASGS
jgi:hypothetical protein